MVNLSISYAGLTLRNPIIAASSGLTDSVHNIKELVAAGVGAIVLKSIFEEEILMEMEQIKNEMVGKPYVYPETMDYMDEEPNDDLIRKYLTLIADCKVACEVPIIASINCVSNQKWVYLAKEIEKAGADAIELNVFSLPSDIHHTSAEVEAMYLDLISQVVKLVSIPVTIKISPYFTSLAQMIKQFESLGVKGLVMFNRFYSPDINIEEEVLSSSYILSSPTDIALPMRWIALLANKTSSDIAASTGVHNGNDLVKLLLAGANAVQIATTIYKNGPKVIAEMKEQLSAWMIARNYKSIGAFRGKLSIDDSDDTAAWERVQFMREFRHFIK